MNTTTPPSPGAAPRLANLDRACDVLREDIRASINRNSLENTCDVPDWIIADYLVRCFHNFVVATCQNGEWHSDRD